MKKSNSTKKALGAFKNLGAVALITATIFFVACKQTGNTGGGGGKPTPPPAPTPKHAITFSVDSTTPNGKLTAKVDGGDITSGKEVEQGKTVTFTATPTKNHRVKEWKVDSTVVTGNKTNIYTHTVTKAATVTVSFEKIPTYKVEFSVDGANGTLTAKVDGGDIASGKEVEEGKTVTFTAEAHTSYRLKEWKVDGTVISNKSNTYTHTITQLVNVIVSFESNSIPPNAPFIEGGASLILSPDKLTISVNATTEDGSAITVEGCNKTTLNNGYYTELHAKGTKVILKGKITKLNCIHSQLTSLNVQGLTALQELNCYENKLTELDVQGLTNLHELSCYKNQLPTLDVQGCTELRWLSCGNNKLTSLNVQGCTALKELYCYSNQLADLDVSGLTELQELYCANNQLSTLNVQGLIALQTLNCSGNKLTELDVQGLTVLKNLICNKNKLNSLNVKGLTALKDLDCRENNLTALDVQGLTALRMLDCSSNRLATLNTSDLTKLEDLKCNNNQLTSLNVQGCTSLKFLLCYSNKLNADAFIKLFRALPTRGENDNAIATLYTEETSETEDNCKAFNTPDGLKAAFEDAKNNKKWMLMKMKAEGFKGAI